MMIIPVTLAWLALLLHEPAYAAGLASFGLLWRVAYDHLIGLAAMPPDERRKTILLKLVSAPRSEFSWHPWRS